MKLSEPRDKATLDETDIEEWTGLELLTFEWDEPFWILRDLPPVVIQTRKSIIDLLTRELAQLEMELDNTVEISEAKNEDLNNLRAENEALLKIKSAAKLYLEHGEPELADELDALLTAEVLDGS